VIVPDGLLHLVPFEALVLSRSASRPVFVLDAWPPVRYAPSGAVLERLAERRAHRVPRPGTLVSVADPALHPGDVGEPRLPGEVLATSGGWSSILKDLPPLPQAEVESARVAAAWSRLSSSAAERLMGAEATEGRTRAAAVDARVLHLATHGIASESEASVLAGLAFAPGTNSPDDDGLLQLHEVYDLKLRADIAVLSACSTQIGRRVEGEGVLSLSRAFLAAGADRVAATLWPVEDRTIGDIVGVMFESTAAAGTDARPRYASALRDAKRKTRLDPVSAHPYYWAGITLTGLE
jgi:CHAT domain-containing protein